jgi:hypothetical protein
VRRQFLISTAEARRRTARRDTWLFAHFLPHFVGTLALSEVRELSGSIWAGKRAAWRVQPRRLAVVFEGRARADKPPIPPSVSVLAGVGAVLLFLVLNRAFLPVVNRLTNGLRYA